MTGKPFGLAHPLYRPVYRLVCCLGLTGLFLAGPAPLHAQMPDLPADGQVRTALDAHPAVRAARAGIAAEAAQQERLEAGPHEFALTVGGTRRRELPTEQRFTEREIGLQRAFRLPGKGALDSRLGAAGVAHAQHMSDEARHETSRLLLSLWSDALRETAAQHEWQRQTEILGEQVRAAARRADLGDGSRLDQALAEAQLAQAEAQRIQAEHRFVLARDALTQHFPSLAFPLETAPAQPLPPEGDAQTWREAVLQDHHELAVARSASQRQRLAAERLDKERLPDPTVSLRWASERDGQEKLVGLQLVIPLPGSARAAASRAGQAEAEAAFAREGQIQAKAESEARLAFVKAQAGFAQWQRLDAVATRMEANAQWLDKAWRLGEGQLTELLTARRLAAEARLAASQARVDANESRYRLLLDAHRLWAFDDTPTATAGTPAGAP